MNLDENVTKYLTAEVYFLIQKFLSFGPLKNTLKTLREELEHHDIFPKRLDWQGGSHERTVEDMERQFANIRPDFLLQLCQQASNGSRSNLKSILESPSFLRFQASCTTRNGTFTAFSQFCNFLFRVHGVPIRDLSSNFNMINVIRGREVSGPSSRHRSIVPNLYNSLQMQRITLGHLSAVYCLLFDHSGKYIITGADDFLIKLWSARNGRLIFCFRGACSEITDIAINLENTLLAAGSIDRILRVWNLHTGAPLAVLTGHTGMITSVNFCPTACWDLRYLISTSSDGSIAFWTFTYNSDRTEFRQTPVLYQEKIRPGQSQMICSSFSPGGTFLATGSADHHVRVYYMKGDEGPQRIVETEAHSDRVDSIQWAHSGLRFVSGSKDGTAIIWCFERQQWKTTCLNMTSKLSSETNKVNEDVKKLRVTMVTWDILDTWVITAVSDFSLKVWNAQTGELEKVLTGHTDEVYVLESHPHDKNVILSAGHDGQLFVWDLHKGEIVFRYLNDIDGQGCGALFDGKWSPDGFSIAASDAPGHLLTFGFGDGDPLLKQMPRELFFHTDYRPLVRDENYHVLDEQTQIPPHLMPPPFLVDIDGNPYPPMLQRLVPGRENCKSEQLVPNIVISNEGTQEIIQDVGPIAERLQEEDDIRGNGSLRNPRRNRDMERLRHSSGDWQSDPNMEWKRMILVQPLKQSQLKQAKAYREFVMEAEIEEYQKQLTQRPHMICTSTSNNQTTEKKKGKKYQTRANRTIYKSNSEPSETSANEDDLSESSGYSDWMAEEGVNLEPPKRSKRRQVQLSISDEDDDDEEDDDDDEDENLPVSRTRKVRSVTENKSEQQPSSSSSAPKMAKIKISEQYKLSEWLSETKPRKSPYYPQMGDDVVYFLQGHQLYLEAVKLKKVYEISSKDLPWNKMEIRDQEFVKVIGIQYEIKPPRLCCLRLAMLDEEGRLTGKNFTVKYHDMPDVLDIFVLKQTYDAAMSHNWKTGDNFRCMIDDNWWLGEIIDTSPNSEEYPNSLFLCYEIRWQNGERERMSPWDLEPIDNNRMPTNENEALPVLEEELNSILYKPLPEDWPQSDRDTVSGYIIAGLTKVMELAIAEPFLVPVDLTIYPTYAFIIEYPIDISTIKARFENKFYRRLTAAQFDVRYLATNAEKFNERHSVIVKNARILTELCLRIIKNFDGVLDVQSVYHQLVDTYNSSDTEAEVDVGPSTSRELTVPNKNHLYEVDWKNEVKAMVEFMWDCEDSIPFRAPVNLMNYPDYKQIVKNPMDLGTVRENLLNDRYESPQHFCQDMRLIFQNSRAYNTNKRSRIYIMTVRLSASFEERMKKILSNWKNEKRKRNIRSSVDSPLSSSSTPSTSSAGSSTGTEHLLSELKSESLQNHKDASDSCDSEDTPIKFLNKINSEESSSQSLQKIEELEEDVEEENSSSSEESYKPLARYGKRKKKIKSSSEDSEEEEDEDEEEFEEEEENQSSSNDSEKSEPVRKRKSLRTRRRKVMFDESSDSEDMSLADHARKKRRRAATSSSSESDYRNSSDRDGGIYSSVSSRGRLRKLTPRAQALMKGDLRFA